MRFAFSTRLSTWVARRGLPTLLALTPLFVGCGLTGDLSPPDPRRGDGAVTIDGGLLDSGELDGSFDGSLEDSAVDAWMPPDAGRCGEVSECEARERSGAPTECEAWACVDGRCVENDYDGDGFGPGCEDVRDCDDFDPGITVDGIVACPPELSRPGICGASAFRTCSGGTLATVCEGFEDPLDAEVCNADDDDCDGRVDEGLPESSFGEGRCAETLSCVGGDVVVTSPAVPDADGCVGESRDVDDDCDGRIDEDCVPDECVYVRVGAAGTGSAAAPLGQLSNAIRAAEERGIGRVCLLAAARMDGGCDPFTYAIPTAAITSDVTIVGGLRADAMGTVSRCSTGAEATSLRPSAASGIRVPSGVTLVLRDLVVPHPDASGVVAQALDVQGDGRLEMFGVRVRGSFGGPIASTRRGVRVQSGGTLVAHASLIEAGAGNTAYAIDAIGATVLLLEGCGPRGCTPTCADRDHGLATSVPGAALRMDHGVLVMDRVAVCVERASTALALSGDVRATIVRSFVEMGPNLVGDVRGVHASSCESLWMHDSRVSMTVGGLDADIPFVAGVDAVNCPALLTDDTVDGLRTNLGRRVDKAYGARCTNTTCTITGSSFTGASSGTGVLEAFGLGCASGCRYVADNVLVGAQVQTESAIGLSLQDSVAATVTRTRAVGGCGGTTVGATVVGGAVRFTNNEAVGVSCTTTSSDSAGLAVEARTGAAFLSRNNSYDAGRVISVDATCSGAGLALRADRRFGTFRNDVYVAGECEFARAVLIENEPPAAFTHAGLVGTYYELAGDRSYSSAADLMADYPLFVGHVFTTTPRFVDIASSLRIQTSSPFAGAGSRLGAPRVDFAGTVRPTPPSIGAWEP